MFAWGCTGGLLWAAVSRIGDALALVLLCNNDHHRITRKRTSDFAPIYFQSGVLTIVACTPATLLMIVMIGQSTFRFPPYSSRSRSASQLGYWDFGCCDMLY